MIKTKIWILIFLLLLAVSIAAVGLLYTGIWKGSVVEILQDGKCIRQIDLAKVKTPYCFQVTDSSGGSNTILVEPGRIRVKEADCPDQVCVHRGWLSVSAAPIVCIPHRLVIQMVKSSDVDAVAN